MSEKSNVLEEEIVELQKLIEAKRNELEDAGGVVVEERDLVRQAVAEMVSSSLPATSDEEEKKKTPTIQNKDNGASYLDNLDEDSVASVNTYIEQISQVGIVKTIKTISEESPYILDAFHDALIDKLYDDLKASGAIK